MKLAYLTACFSNLSLEEKIKFASEQKLDAIELSCWPVTNDRDYSSTDIDVSKFNEKTKEELLELISKNNIQISSLAYYDNNLLILFCNLEQICIRINTLIAIKSEKHFNEIETFLS